MKVFINGIDLTGPGKQVLLLVSDYHNTEDVFQLKQHLEREFPETKFVLLGGIDQAIVMDRAPSYDFEVVE